MQTDGLFPALCSMDSAAVTPSFRQDLNALSLKDDDIHRAQRRSETDDKTLTCEINKPRRNCTGLWLLFFVCLTAQFTPRAESKSVSMWMCSITCLALGDSPLPHRRRYGHHLDLVGCQPDVLACLDSTKVDLTKGPSFNKSTHPSERRSQQNEIINHQVLRAMRKKTPTSGMCTSATSYMVPSCVSLPLLRRTRDELRTITLHYPLRTCFRIHLTVTSWLFARSYQKQSTHTLI